MIIFTNLKHTIMKTLANEIRETRELVRATQLRVKEIGKCTEANYLKTEALISKIKENEKK